MAYVCSHDHYRFYDVFLTVEKEMNDMMLGFLKSKTVYLGSAIATLPLWYPLIETNVLALAGPSAKDLIVNIMGIAVVLVRFSTGKTLSEKGAA